MNCSEPEQSFFFADDRVMAEEMKIIQRQRHNPFVKDGKVDAEAYGEFVVQFNEFIGHAPKPFVRMIDRDMRL